MTAKCVVDALPGLRPEHCCYKSNIVF